MKYRSVGTAGPWVRLTPEEIWARAHFVGDVTTVEIVTKEFNNYGQLADDHPEAFQPSH